MIAPEAIIEYLNATSKNTLIDNLGIKFIEAGHHWIAASMPVDSRTFQPYGILHGGASIALAETLGGAGSALIVDQNKYTVHGMEINANHVRSVKTGYVYAKARLIHKGENSHIWEIKITNEEKELVCICRLTNIIKRIKE